jgi:hypothetical protein
LIRYLIGLAFVVFGSFFLLYKKCATRLFLKRYHDPQKVTGVVIACTLNTNSKTSARYDVQVVFSAAPSNPTDYVKHPDVESFGEVALSQEYLHIFTSYWMSPPGSKIDLYCIPDRPQSAVTKDLLDEKKASFSWFAVIAVLLPAIAIGGSFVALCADVIGDFPKEKRWVGWTIFSVCTLCFFGFGWGICDDMFCEYIADNFLSSQPVYRKVSTMRPPSTIVLTPPSSPRAQNQSIGDLGDLAGIYSAQNLGIQHCRSQSSLTTDND